MDIYATRVAIIELFHVQLLAKLDFEDKIVARAKSGSSLTSLSYESR